jgi:hypothetical protein
MVVALALGGGAATTALLACAGEAFSESTATVPPADASTFDGDAASPRDATSFDGDAASQRDVSPEPDASGPVVDAVADQGTDHAESDGGERDAACACVADAQEQCAPACGQWSGSRACASDCSGYGACVTSPFSWSASATDGGFLHDCTGAVDQYGNWQTDYTATPNGCLAQYGPYLQVPRGAYQANVQVWGTADTVVVSVANHSGMNTLESSGEQSLTAGWSTIAVPDFRIDDDLCTGVEFRVQWVNATGVAIVVGPSTLVRTGP